MMQKNTNSFFKCINLDKKFESVAFTNERNNNPKILSSVYTDRNFNFTTKLFNKENYNFENTGNSTKNACSHISVENTPCEMLGSLTKILKHSPEKNKDNQNKQTLILSNQESINPKTPINNDNTQSKPSLSSLNESNNEEDKVVKIENLLKYVDDVDDVALFSMKKYWPGGLTLIFKKSKLCPSYIAPLTVAIRIPNHPLFKDVCMCSKSGVLATTSLNYSGENPCESYLEAVEKFGDKCRIFKPYKDFKKQNVPSTIVNFSKKPYEILRQGLIKFEV